MTKKEGASLHVPQKPVSGMQGDYRSSFQPANQIAHTADMVKMCMRTPDLTDVPVVFSCFCKDDLSIPSGVDDRCCAGIGVSYDVSVGRNRTKHKVNNFEHLITPGV